MSLFITFEGADGSGKTTQIALLTDYLENKGYQVHCTREPGGTAIGEEIREVLHDVEKAEMHAITEILLYSASRAQLVSQIVRPILADGGVVLCDRYADSTYAYQGFGRGLDLATLKTITQFATQGLQPDFTIYLDLPVEIGLQRKQQANQLGAGEWNRMDQLKIDFHQRVRNGYLTMAKAEPTRWLVVDASQSVAEVHEEICTTLLKTVSIDSNTVVR